MGGRDWGTGGLRYGMGCIGWGKRVRMRGWGREGWGYGVGQEGRDEGLG